jgi:hypothetical protein
LWPTGFLTTAAYYDSIKDPAVVTALKGRPRGSGPFAGDGTVPTTLPARPGPARGADRLSESIRRNLSEWEVIGPIEQEQPASQVSTAKKGPLKKRATAKKPPSSAPAAADTQKSTRLARGGVSKATGSTKRAPAAQGSAGTLEDLDEVVEDEIVCLAEF